jgi:hypothetical protein
VEGLRDENGLVVVVLGAGDGGKGFFFREAIKRKVRKHDAKLCVRRAGGALVMSQVLHPTPRAQRPGNVGSAPADNSGRAT